MANSQVTEEDDNNFCSSDFVKENVSVVADLQSSLFSRLRASLKDVCSFDDFKQQMSVYLSFGTCEDIFQVMTQITKTIDEGRLNMKAHCSVEYGIDGLDGGSPLLFKAESRDTKYLTNRLVYLLCAVLIYLCAVAYYLCAAISFVWRLCPTTDNS